DYYCQVYDGSDVLF
nr:immunoglobulin light chain junction region [Macaca mulatta]MOV95121.1 immunoglobulin light chain junction region [Macaca mulatta]MOV95314.1 immunoglobulin light chain junction region [Macaca mulatta]MOV96466.1 immunoglobulin light chain junction region [Macaca mulatta]MOV98359.1 immunoglobulin light chain junction region [Macaca mulatta]